MTTTLSNTGLRKAAIFVSSLDRNAADLVLDQMSPEQARLVRQMMVELDEPNPEEQRRVLEEFRRGNMPAGRKAAADDSGIELDGRLAEKPARGDTLHSAGTHGVHPTGVPFRFLRETEADKLAKILATERPQVIALVLSHLPAEQAGKVLVRLAPGVQVDVIRRLVDLEETDTEILREVEHGLKQRLSELVRMQRRRVAGLSAVTGILEASKQQIGMQILGNVARHDPFLAERLTPDRIEFSEVLRLDDRTLGALLAAAETELVVLALVGAPPDWSDRWLGLLPPYRSGLVRRELDHLQPTRLADVEEARKHLADLARRLMIEGRITLPPHARRAA